MAVSARPSGWAAERRALGRKSGRWLSRNSSAEPYSSRPYPCRYVITSSKVKGSPQYTIDVRDWKTGDEVASDGFSLAIPEGAKELKPGDVPDFDELPALFTKKGAQ